MTESPAEKGKRLFEKEEAVDIEAANKFDPKKILSKADEIRKIMDPILGEISYTVLTTGDVFEVNKIEDKEAKAKAILFRLLRKAYPDLKEGDIDRFPMDVTTRLLQLLMSDDIFFQTPQQLKSGSESTATRKQLVS
jgi:hypothetical protein